MRVELSLPSTAGPLPHAEEREDYDDLSNDQPNGGETQAGEMTEGDGNCASKVMAESPWEKFPNMSLLEKT